MNRFNELLARFNELNELLTRFNELLASLLLFVSYNYVHV